MYFQGKDGGFLCCTIVPFLMLLNFCVKLPGDDIHHWLPVKFSECAAFLWKYKNRGEHPRNSTHQVSKKCIFSSHSALPNIFLNIMDCAVQCLKNEMGTWGSAWSVNLWQWRSWWHNWGVFSVLIAQGCLVLSNQKSLPVFAALIPAASHTYPAFGPSGQDGSLMDHIPRSADRAASLPQPHRWAAKWTHIELPRLKVQHWFFTLAFRLKKQPWIFFVRS